MAKHRTFIALLLTAFIASASPNEICQELNEYFPTEIAKIFQQPTIRNVDSAAGVNSPECLNEANTTNPPPCRTLHYGLHGSEDPMARANLSDIVIHLAPGHYSAVNGSVQVLNSKHVAIIGAGAESTFFHCGALGDDDAPCAYLNFQIRASSYVYVSGITFTQCGPITSIVYVAETNFLFFKDCVFRDLMSPPVLLYNTPAAALINIEFSNNRPQYLNATIANDRCYFSGAQDIFFLDNRTTSGGVSFYVDMTTDVLISNCTFRNNSARPDVDISLPRAADRYGHGGAMNIRLFDDIKSRLCIERSIFEGNFAETHAGALAIAFAGSAINNTIVVYNSTFINNSCQLEKCSAGGVGIDFFSGTEFNEIILRDLNFTGNKAKTGGAVTASAATLAGLRLESDSVIFENCWFERNKATFEGTAMGVFSNTHADQPGLHTRLVDCQFIDNEATGGSADTTAVTMYRVLVTFEGNGSFITNRGGGISLLESRMDVKGSLVLDGNSAVFGGAIAMSGRSLLLLYSGAHMRFLNNNVTEEGAGIYVETTSSDFVLSVLNRGCFIQYFTESIDIAPSDWNATIEFINNTAGLAGAAIYANDMSRCKWLGEEAENFTQDYFIFSTPEGFKTPFKMSNNRVLQGGTEVKDQDLGTDAFDFSAETVEFNSSISPVSYGERVSLRLSSSDQFNNFRATVWSLNVNNTFDPQPLGALSSSSSIYVFDVPPRDQLEGPPGNINLENGTADLVAEFTLLGTQDSTYTVPLKVGDCHPGYEFNNDTQQCECQDHISEIIRCDTFDRYFYVKDGFWVGVREDNTTYFSTTIPSFLNCTKRSGLPGCIYEFDRPDDQCASGREGVLCGDCESGYGVTFDLRFCKPNCGAWGIILFIFICVLTLVLTLFVLYFDFPLPNELKAVLFFAQVIGVIYRNTPYLQDEEPSPGYRFFDFLINALGFAMPFPVCLREGLPTVAVMFLGFIPPLIATVTSMVYVLCAKKIRFLSKRTEYKFNGFYLLWLFVYKYLVDTTFIFVSCTRVDNDFVFLYEGSLPCLAFPFIIFFIFGLLLLFVLGIALPVYVIYLIYLPKKAIQVANTLTEGLKDRRRYRWYGVWDIWRRLLFVAANLFISLATRSTVLFIDCILVLICLAVVCIVKPYKKLHINVLEMVVMLCLFGTTLALLDENDLYIGFITSATFIAFPFLYGIVYIIYRISRYVWHKANKRWPLNAMVKEMTKTVTEGILSYKPAANLWLFIQKHMHRMKEGEQPDEVVEEKPVVILSNEELELHRRDSSSELREPMLEETLH